jgi:hypothetical protein
MIKLSVTSSSRAEGGSPGSLEYPLHQCHEVTMFKLGRGDVDCHIVKLEAPFTPPHCLTAGLSQHPLPQLQDQPALLAQGDEARRRDHPLLWVNPAHQRLCTHHPTAGELQLGLIPDRKVLLPECILQPDFKLETALALITHAGIKIADPVTPSPFRGMHGKIRMTHQLGGIAALLREAADPDAGGDHHVPRDAQFEWA